MLRPSSYFFVCVTRVVLASLLILPLLYGVSGASKIKKLDLAELARRADIIALGLVTQVHQEGNRDRVIVELAVVLKGKTTKREVVLSLVTRGGLKDFDPALKKGQLGVFFLSRQGKLLHKAYWGSVATFPKPNFIHRSAESRRMDGARDFLTRAKAGKSLLGLISKRGLHFEYKGSDRCEGNARGNKMIPPGKLKAPFKLKVTSDYKGWQENCKNRRPETRAKVIDLKLLLDGADHTALTHQVKDGQLMVELEFPPSMIRFFFRLEGRAWVIHRLAYEIEDPG